VRPQAAWQRLRPTIGEPALLLSSNVSGLTAQMLGLPVRIVAEIDEHLPVVGAAAVAEETAETELALAVHVKSGPRLVRHLTMGSEAWYEAEPQPGGELVWLTLKPDAARRDALSPAVLAVLDSYLLVGSSRAGIERLGPYLTRTLARDGPDRARAGLSDSGGRAPELWIELGPAALGGPAEQLLDRTLGGAQERELPPLAKAFADLPSLESTFRHAVRDLSRVQIAARLDRGGVDLDLRATVEPEAFAARWSTLPTMAPDALLDLPDDTVVAAAWAEPLARRKQGAQTSGESLRDLLGKSGSETDGQALRTALLALAEGRGDHSAAGLRCTGVGLTGFVRGSVRDGDKLVQGLEGLAAFRNHPRVQAELQRRGLRLSWGRARVAELPSRARRLRLSPIASRTAPKPPTGPNPSGAPLVHEPIDLLVWVTEDRFLAAGGLEAAETLLQLYRPEPAKTLRSRPAMPTALGQSPAKIWLALLVDSRGLLACQMGRPGADAATPLAVLAGPEPAAEGQARLRIHAHTSALRILAELLAD